jgi:hypothetical protein
MDQKNSEMKWRDYLVLVIYSNNSTTSVGSYFSSYTKSPCMENMEGY